jgi:8-oxo-dGTP diphosphatase
MISASGGCFLAINTGRIMLQQRSKHVSHPYTWSFWGGKAEDDERPIETLIRECKEEIGDLPAIEKIYPIHTFLSEDNNFTYHTFVITVYEEFVPKTNIESSGYSWVQLENYPEPLHKGAKIVLEKSDIVDKIKTIWDNSQNISDMSDWLDTF